MSLTGSYDAPFVPMAALLFLGALLWLKIDASENIAGVVRPALMTLVTSSEAGSVA